MGGSRRHPQMRAVKQVRGGTAFMIHPRGVGLSCYLPCQLIRQRNNERLDKRIAVFALG